jgi:hypothetical protein
MISHIGRVQTLIGAGVLAVVASVAGGMLVAAIKIDAGAWLMAFFLVFLTIVGVVAVSDATTGDWIDAEKLRARLTSLGAALALLEKELGEDSDPEMAACRARLLAEIAVFRSETEVKKWP